MSNADASKRTPPFRPMIERRSCARTSQATNFFICVSGIASCLEISAAVMVSPPCWPKESGCAPGRRSHHANAKCDLVQSRTAPRQRYYSRQNSALGFEQHIPKGTAARQYAAHHHGHSTSRGKCEGSRGACAASARVKTAHAASTTTKKKPAHPVSGLRFSLGGAAG